VLKLPAPRNRPTQQPTEGTARRRPSDPEIVAGLTRGESWAADELYDRIQPYVERTLRRVLRYSGADFEDLVQASFERIIRVLSERSLGGACDLPTWSSAVAAHVALDALRRRVRERKLFRHEPAPELLRAPEHGVERSVEARFDVARVQGIFGRMKAKHAETIVLHDVLGHDLSEVAVLTGVSVAAAQSRLVRGRKELLRRARAERRNGT
jgi:RNA polymerase sigma-70 factor (ECF subfamily)